jgi:hypothetical protein
MKRNFILSIYLVIVACNNYPPINKELMILTQKLDKSEIEYIKNSEDFGYLNFDSKIYKKINEVYFDENYFPFFDSFFVNRGILRNPEYRIALLTNILRSKLRNESFNFDSNINRTLFYLNDYLKMKEKFRYDSIEFVFKKKMHENYKKHFYGDTLNFTFVIQNHNNINNARYDFFPPNDFDKFERYDSLKLKGVLINKLLNIHNIEGVIDTSDIHFFLKILEINRKNTLIFDEPRTRGDTIAISLFGYSRII